MILMIFVLLFLIGCQNSQPASPNPQTSQMGKDDEREEGATEVNADFSFHDLGDTAYFITWGDSAIYSNRSRPFKVLGNGRLGLEATSPNALLLSQSCGTSCAQYVVLPRLKGGKEHIYLFGRAYELTRGLVAYIPEDEEVLITVENYLSGKGIPIKESDVCEAAFRGDCIQSCRFQGDSLSLTFWDNKDQTQTRFYSIQSLIESPK